MVNRKHLHRIFRLTITTLSPLHIGTGNRLLSGYDFVTKQGKTWVIDNDALASELYDYEEFDNLVNGTPPSELLQESDYQPDSPLFRYVIAGVPQAVTKGSQIQELMKDAWDRPYIPGSSLKGALRTALAVVGWHQRTLVFNPDGLDGPPKFAAIPMENQVLQGQRPDPNHSLLRAVQVSDSQPADKSRIVMGNIQVQVGNKAGSPIDLELVAKDTVFTSTLSLDGHLQRDNVASELGFEKAQLSWIKNLIKVANSHTELHLGAERAHWKESDFGMMRSFYRQLSQQFEQLDKDAECILQLGWGAGWNSKTFGGILTQNNDLFYRVVKKYGKFMDRKNSFKTGDKFPKSRRVRVNLQGDPIQPLGWLRIKWEREA